MKTIKEKQLEIELLSEKLERLSGKKISLQEETSSETELSDDNESDGPNSSSIGNPQKFLASASLHVWEPRVVHYKSHKAKEKWDVVRRKTK